MARVTGIGGIFFKARDPKALGAWYTRNLGPPVQDWGGVRFPWRDQAEPEREGYTVWSLFQQNSNYFDPGTKPFMVNYIVDDLDAIRAGLRDRGVTVDDRTEESEFGRFGWAMGPEGNRLELWEPPRKAGP